jgi:carboxymethylenebutenolidase
MTAITAKLMPYLLALLVVTAALSLAAPATAQTELPAAGDDATTRLNSSPRHTEWVEIEADGDRIDAFVVYPERADNAPVVVVIHEIFGLNDWARAVADQLAAEGFIAIAPDMLSGKGPEGGSRGLDNQSAVALMRELDNDEVTRRIDMAAAYAMALPAATDSFGVVGFCWGGSTVFRYATENGDLDAAVVYYGGSPDTETLSRIEAPVMGFYGGDDQRVNATIPAAEAEMDRLGKHYAPHVYEGAGHGFLRAQNDRDGANRRASEQAWPATVEFLRAQLEAR